MSIVEELGDKLALPHKQFIDAALASLLVITDSSQLTAVATWARHQAAAHATRAQHGALEMIAGAASARACALTREVEIRTDDAALISALNDLQSRLDSGADAAGCLREFAPLGATTLTADVDPYLDMKLKTDVGDTVFYWTSGTLALKQRLSGAHGD